MTNGYVSPPTRSGFHVGLEFPRVGKLLCNNCKYHFSFAESLLEAVSKLDSVLSVLCPDDRIYFFLFVKEGTRGSWCEFM